MDTVIPCLVAFLVTFLFMLVLRPVAQAIHLVDVPGGRKRHQGQVPVIGGLAMYLGLIFSFGLSVVPHVGAAIVMGITLLVFVGVVDDRFELPPAVRLAAQACATLIAVYGSQLAVTNLGSALFVDVDLGVLGFPFTMLLVLTIINAFNMVDGIDGLAGGIAFVGLAFSAVIGVRTDLLGLNLILLSVVAGFLFFNSPFTFNRKLRAFMGDAGSTFLGLTIAALGIALSQGDAPRMAPVIGLWLIAVPLYDLFCTIVRRLVQGKSPFTPDHGHLHHMLMAEGLSERDTLIVMLLLSVLAASLGVAADVLLVPDAIMLVLWLAGGFAYYQMMRHPRRAAAVVLTLKALRRRHASLGAPATERSATSRSKDAPVRAD